MLHNCVAHSDYSKSSRIIVLEYNNRLIFQNAGGFIPDSVEEVIRRNSPQDYYRNPFLANAMVNLNMIETAGNGIQKGRSTSLEIVGANKPEGLSNKDYKQMILNLLAEKGSATKEEIETLLFPLLPTDLTEAKKTKKISNLITELSFQEARIKNVSSSKKFAVWQIVR